MVRRIKRERSAAPIADVKKEAGPPPAKKPKGKSEGKGGKNKGARYTVDQAGVQLCFSWNFGGGTCGEAHVRLAEFTMHHVSVGQALSETVPTGLTRSRGGRNWDSGGGFSILDCARRRMFDFPALFFGSGEIRAGRGLFRQPQLGAVSRSESSTETSSEMAPICLRTSLSLRISRPL